MLRPCGVLRLVQRFSSITQSSHGGHPPAPGKLQRPDAWCQYYDRPTQEPIETSSVLLFPGQGAQFVGMGRNLVEVQGVNDMFETASSILRTNLLKTCLEGPAEKLEKTIHCQPAIYVTSLAAVKKLQMDSPELVEKCVAAAGYSIGEITALVYSGAYSFEEGLHLVRVRAEAMQRACDLIASGMLTVTLSHDSQLRLALSAAINHCKECLKMDIPVICQVASYLGPECKVIAGNTEALDYIVKHFHQFRLASVRKLEVAGAFHTPLMLPAVEALKHALQRVGPARTPCIPVVSNVDAEPYGKGSTVPLRLTKQITRPLCWEQSLHALFGRPEGVPFPRIVEVGPGRQLGASLRMVNAKAFTHYQFVEV